MTNERACKLSHVRETKDDRHFRMEMRRARQLALVPPLNFPTLVRSRSEMIVARRQFLASQVGYLPHQGERECGRRAARMTT